MAKIAFGFFLLFFLELWVIIKVGSVLGAFMVILLMIFGAGYGVSLVRSQGLRTMMTLQQQLAQGIAPERLPAAPQAHRVDKNVGRGQALADL